VTRARALAAASSSVASVCVSGADVLRLRNVGSFHQSVEVLVSRTSERGARAKIRDPGHTTRRFNVYRFYRFAPRSRVSLRSPGIREGGALATRPKSRRAKRTVARSRIHDVKQRSVVRSRGGLLRPGLSSGSSPDAPLLSEECKPYSTDALRSQVKIRDVALIMKSRTPWRPHASSGLSHRACLSRPWTSQHYPRLIFLGDRRS
jgi:hypothetical protein